ncbi:transcriptional regulator KorA [Pseudomonas cichorii]|nr:transcriptional regulator KorA [Pseudomonas cichorii]MBX8493148.1 transcriptional regulator KorA [Pseudomonas cichorii]
MNSDDNRHQQLTAMAALIKSTYKPVDIDLLIQMIRPDYKNAELSSEEFAKLISKLKSQGMGRPYSEKSIEAARLVLVQGASMAEAGREVGMRKDQISQLMKRIREILKSLN